MINNVVFVTLNKLEAIERKYGMIGTIFGIFLIVLTIMATIFSIYVIVNGSFHILDWICKEFFGFKLF